jgi:pimeloyl-ACP methyl ester carboxylesterase
MFTLARAEAYRQGVAGAVDDLMLVNSPWAFAPSDVAVKVLWWHGEVDPVTPIVAVREVLAGIATSTLTVYPHEGHTVGITHADEILATMKAQTAPKTKARQSFLVNALENEYITCLNCGD